MMRRPALLRRRALVALLAWPLGCATQRTEPEYVGLSSGHVDTAVRAEMRRVPITMYMTSWCPHCRRASDWLTRGGYTFEMLDVDEDDEAADVLEAINPRGAVPTFDIQGHVVFGFAEEQLELVIQRVARLRLQTAVR